jgi:hypothetical protein
VKATPIPLCAVIFVWLVTVRSFAYGQDQPLLIGVLEDNAGISRVSLTTLL